MALLVLAGVPGRPERARRECQWVAGWGLGLLFTPANNAAVMSAAPGSRSGVLGGLLGVSEILCEGVINKRQCPRSQG